MGRKRKHDNHLPQRLYQHRGTYYFVDKTGKGYNLAKDLVLAMAEYGKLVGSPCGHAAR